MTVRDIAGLEDIEVCYEYEENRDVDNIFCCDLLSVAMARATEISVWITVMGNANVVAVATLADVSCIVIAEGYSFDEAALAAAKGKITLLKSPHSIYDTAVEIGKLL